jgi:hypothetical protein
MQYTSNARAPPRCPRKTGTCGGGKPGLANSTSCNAATRPRITVVRQNATRHRRQRHRDGRLNRPRGFHVQRNSLFVLSAAPVTPARPGAPMGEVVAHAGRSRPQVFDPPSLNIVTTEEWKQRR